MSVTSLNAPLQKMRREWSMNMYTTTMKKLDEKISKTVNRPGQKNVELIES
jgi:hypothetical protein